MEDPEGRRPRRLDPKAASLAGFLSPHPSSTTSQHSGSSGWHGGGSGGGGSGGWKARLKERCLNRVRQERDRLVQEMRGLASPPPDCQAGGAQAPSASAEAAAAARPFLSPLPNGAGAARVGAAGAERSSTPSSFSGAALSILRDEMRLARREQEEGDGGGGRMGVMMAIAEKGEDGEGEELSPEEHWELMRCIEEALAQEVSLAEELAAGEYSQLEHAEVEGSVAQLYDYEELPDEVAVLCPRCKTNYLIAPDHDGAHSAHSRPGSRASVHSIHSAHSSSLEPGAPVLCPCGLRVELPAGVGLAQLQERLAAVYGHHRASACPVREPTFYQREPGRNLWVECGSCGLNAQVV